MVNIGVARGKVKVVPYDSRWSEEFEREQALLLAEFPDEVLEVEHIGSTAVPGLAAKPIIDMFVGVSDLQIAEEMQQKMEKLGYEYRGSQGRPERRLYVKGPESRRTHHAHFVILGSEEWNKQLRFREHLRTHDNIRDEYTALKQRLSEKFPDDRKSYSEAKDVFIRDLFKREGI